MADATAAEVKHSASEYDLAREELSGYQIVLDLLVARHFGHPKAPGLLEHGDNLDLASRARFMASLDDLEELALVERVEALARQPDRRFFRWEIEFPEVFFGFSDANERHLKHKNEIVEGSAGFDAVVGNPPYVRQETIKPFKDFLKTNYQTFDSTNDLYVYFQEQEIRHLRADGRMGMIVANKWMRAGYGERLRAYLMQTACPREVVDFGHSPIFPDADTFLCSLIVSRRFATLSASAPVDGEAMATCAVPREDWDDRMDLAAYVSRARYSIPTLLLRNEGWSLEDPRVQTLLDKLRRVGAPLQEFCGAGTFRGSGTGLNDAFFIDETTRNRLIAEDKKSAEVIKPLLRGRDIDRWRAYPSETSIIFAIRGISIDRYPAINRHLNSFRERLEPRPSNWTDSDGEWPGRRSGDYRWYELQDSPSQEAALALAKPKIVYQEMAWFNSFALDISGAALTNTAYVIRDTRATVLAALNSPLAWWYMWRVAQHGKDEVLRLIGAFMDVFPMPTATSNMGVDAEALFDAYRRVSLAKSKSLGPRIIAIMTARLVREKRTADEAEDRMLAAAEELSDEELVAFAKFVREQTAIAATTGDSDSHFDARGNLVVALYREQLDSNWISNEHISVGPMDLVECVGGWAGKMKSLGIMVDDVKEQSWQYREDSERHIDMPGSVREISWWIYVPQRHLMLATLVDRVAASASLQ